MAKSQKILDEKEVSKQKIKSFFKPKESTDTPSRETEELINLWKEEIESLKSTVFHSVEEAVTAISSNVVTKLSLTGQQAEKTRLFVEDILLTDPTITEQLKGVLRIK